VANKVTRGEGPNALQRWADRTEQEMQDYYNPQGAAGTAGQIGGRLVGEAVTTGAGGAGLGKLLSKIPQAAKILAAGAKGNFLTRAATKAAPFAPLDVVQGAGSSEGGFVLPGRAGAAAEQVAMGVLPLAAFESLSGIGKVKPKAPTAPQMKALPPGKYEMGPVTTRLEPEVRPDRLIPSSTPHGTPTAGEGTLGPAIPMRGQVAPEDVIERLRAALPPEPRGGGLEVLRENAPRSRQRQSLNMKAIQGSQDRLDALGRSNRAFPTPSTEATSALETASEAGKRMRGAPPKSPIISRSGIARPEAVMGLGGAGIGAVGGSIVDQEDPLRGALVSGLAGAAGGVGLGKVAYHGQKLSSSTPALQQGLEGIAHGDRATPGRRGFLTPAQRIYAKLVDESFALRQLGKMADPADRARLGEIASLSKASSTQAHTFLEEELKPILKDAKDVLGDVLPYAKARRALDIISKGGANKTGNSLELLQQQVSDGGAIPSVKDAADRLTEFYRKLLLMRKDAGVISDVEYQRIIQSDDFYTPFEREWAKESILGRGVKRVFGGGKGLKAMDRSAGSATKTVDPFESAVFATQETFKVVGKQRVSNIIGELATSNPQALRGIVEEIPTAKIGSEPTLHTVQTIVNGKTRTFKLDSDIYDAWGGMDPKEMGAFMQGMRAIKRGVQMGTTLMPDFALANLTRDTGMSAIQNPLATVAKRAGGGAAAGGFLGGMTADPDESVFLQTLKGAGLGAGAATVGPQALKALRAAKWIVTDDAIYREFLHSGAATDGFYVRTQSDARKVLRALQKEGVSASDIINPKSWVEALQYVGQVAERSTRLAKYADVKQAGGSIRQAAAAARDVSLDFAKVGSETKGLASVTPFWNAQIQGWDKLTRMLKKPETWAAGAMTLTAPSMALWAINKDNLEYQAAPAWQKNLFWMIPKEGGGFYRIPKPFEVGFLFASLPERLADFAYAKTRGEEGTDASGVFASSIVSMFTAAGQGVIPAPPGANILFEQLANKDLFRRRQIQTGGGLPEEGGDIYTSAPAIGLAKAFSKVPGMGNTWFASPQRIDHLIGALGSSGGRMLADIATRAAKATGHDDRPAPAFQTFPLTQRFISQPGRYQSDQEASVRGKFQRPHQVSITAGKLLESYDEGQATAEEIAAFYNKHQKDLEEYERLKPVIKDLDDLSRMKKEISTAGSLSQKERQETIAALSTLSVRVATTKTKSNQQ